MPELLPPAVVHAYRQAEQTYFPEGNEDASGTMYRKALDVGLKLIEPALTGTLGAKIKCLTKTGKLTAELAAWADQVREIGNEAAHDADPLTRDELTALRSFTEMVLTYLFTLPNMVRKRRGVALLYGPVDPAP